MKNPSNFEHLLAPGRIGSLTLRNRILMTPMGSNLAEPNGEVGERIQAYYEARAKGGAGCLIVGVGAICWPEGACNPNQVAISNDRFLPGLSALTERVHRHGAKIAIQLQHASKVAIRDIAAGRPMLVPSLPKPKATDLMNDLTPQERAVFVADYTKKGATVAYEVMTKERIAEIVERFAEAAERAQRTGFDAVELHAGHGYLLSSFLSPASNQRDDEYGGSLENRARFLVEVIRAAKQRVGSDFPVWCRIDSKEFETEGGIGVEDAQRTAELAEAAGADAIHASAYADPSKGFAFTVAPLVHTPGGYIEFAKGIKRCVHIPVIAVGRIEPARAEELIASGGADFVAMGRKLLADPELPNKLGEGRPEDIRPCIYCYTCVGKIFLNEGLRCAVNPATGCEFERSDSPAAVVKRVLIIGGGPAGMEAARVAATRGHEVILCEKSKRLGGTLFFASLAYEANGELVRWLDTQVRKLDIDLRLDCEVTPALVAELAPDAVVVAVGAVREAPPIPGVDRPEVLTGDDLRHLITGGDKSVAARKLSRTQRAVMGVGKLAGATDGVDRIRELTKLWMPLGKRVVVIGGGLVGLELAEFLLERGRQVVVLESSETFGSELAPPRRWHLLHALRSHGARLIVGARVEEIGEEGVIWLDAEDTRATEPADSILLAIGTTENRSLGEALAKQHAEVHLIGDCSGVGYIEGAIAEGNRVGQQL